MFSGMNVTQLRAECKSRGLSGYSKARKETLVQMLDEYERIQEARVKLEDIEPDPQTQRSPESDPVKVEPSRPVQVASAHPRRVGDKFTKYPSKQARNRAKRRRKELRRAGFQAGFG